MTSLHTTLTFLAALTLSACATNIHPTATAQLTPTTGNTTSGSVRFVQTGDTMRVNGTITGLKPATAHGFHIHEKGDCSSGDGMSAGGHFNPSNTAHGQHGHGVHHAGDLPSLQADANGTATFSFTSNDFANPTNIVGRSLIVHRDPDDYTTQPTGNSGPRLACAVITKQ